MICRYFLSSVNRLFPFLMVSFEAQTVLSLMKPNLSTLSFITYTFVVISRKSFPNPRSQRFTPVFHSKSLIVLTVPFRSVVHLELIFCGVRQGFRFILFHLGISCVCWKSSFFAPLNCLASLSKIN